jgi:hypothetical protein
MKVAVIVKCLRRALWIELSLWTIAYMFGRISPDGGNFVVTAFDNLHIVTKLLFGFPPSEEYGRCMLTFAGGVLQWFILWIALLSFSCRLLDSRCHKTH